jgi:hypothetical protein
MQRLAAIGYPADEAAPVPDDEVMATIIDAAFWASLRREEGFTPKISLAFLPPERSAHPLLFAHALPLLPEALARLSPAVERPGIHLGVWGGARELAVWGTTRTLPPYCFVLEVISPGLLVLKHSPGEDSGKFGNVAVLEGDKVKILALHGDGQRKHTADLRSVLELASIGEPGSAARILPQLAVSMRAHGRGGTLLFVPGDSAEWRESIRSITYNVEPPFAQLAQLGGTRHLSAAQFVQDHHQAFALVASQDGRFTLLAWSEDDKMVQAHRMETVLV